ncbi:MAG TPA: glycosyltransferase family 4 protein [Pyrinomonadaceae bacterium]|nr:glycosyltransferase family 4 protein [Pyrinomonadaceae bacterium]
MRILQISSARTFGGGERHVVDLCRGLAELGHDVFAAVRPTCMWRDRLDFLPDGRILEVTMRNSFGVLSAMKIADFARENGIQIIHAHVARDYIPASIACMAAKGTRFILTRHVLFPLKPFNRFALKNVASAIGVSEAAGKALRNTFPAERITVINNGIDLDRYDTRDADRLRKEFREFHSIPRDTPLVGTLGELKELKGQRDFLLAAHEILKAVPDCQFVVAGQDNTIDGRFRRELRRLVSVLGMEDRFIWLDWMQDTAPFYAGIDIFVSPSHSESFGLAILEAMARGKAIVSTDTDGARQLLDKCGRIVPIKDPVKLSRAVVEVLSRRMELLEMGAKAKMEAADKYSLKKMIYSTEALYESVLADAKGTSSGE